MPRLRELLTRELLAGRLRALAWCVLLLGTSARGGDGTEPRSSAVRDALTVAASASSEDSTCADPGSCCGTDHCCCSERRRQCDCDSDAPPPLEPAPAPRPPHQPAAPPIAGVHRQFARRAPHRVQLPVRRLRPGHRPRSCCPIPSRSRQEVLSVWLC